MSKHTSPNDSEQLNEGVQMIEGQELKLSHTDKVFWPEEGYTKGDVLHYYNTIYKTILPYLKDRPESLRRMPDGIGSAGFFQKDAGKDAPEWVDTYTDRATSTGKEVHYILCNNRATLLYLANMGCIEINPWNSRIQKPDNPDYLVLDLDPSEENTFDQVVDTALVIKEIMDKAGADCYAKTSGATGMHIYVPLGSRYTYGHARDFAHIIATLAHEQLPDITSLERRLSQRGKDKLYIDYLQNSEGQTLACAYSLRPKPGATVSAPLLWKEVKHGLRPTDFTLKNMAKRIDKTGDLFSPVLGKGIDLNKCLKKLA